MDPEPGKVNPYGVYDQTANAGWVNVGTDHDTAELAVETIRRGWLRMGISRYPDARELLITADGGGSNGYRLRLWKVALQGFANATGLTVRVCHSPPGTRKWNKIEHRMLSFLTTYQSLQTPQLGHSSRVTATTNQAVDTVRRGS